MPEDYRELAARVAGSIVISDEPGKALKLWRERLQIRQVALARKIGISPSVLSDYESGRRPSPGVSFIRKYIDALVKMDMEEKHVLTKTLEPSQNSAILALAEFPNPVIAARLVKAVEGQVLSGNDMLDSKIYGFTLLDSIKTIYALSGYDFYRIFGATTERVLVFTKVGMGRSPLVAIRVSQLKPRMVVVHGPKTVDPLAVALAEKEKIILVLSL
ncbi:MAG: helix-turn-helix domain-containing protein, partial [Thaumarchaeota archaeon]|nr:helix-turn-helix domain-containing protein [Nitrososphaerota archaeon]